MLPSSDLAKLERYAQLGHLKKRLTQFIHSTFPADGAKDASGGTKDRKAPPHTNYLVLCSASGWAKAVDFLEQSVEQGPPALLSPSVVSAAAFALALDEFARTASTTAVHDSEGRRVRVPASCAATMAESSSLVKQIRRFTVVASSGLDVPFGPLFTSAWVDLITQAVQSSAACELGVPDRAIAFLPTVRTGGSGGTTLDSNQAVGSSGSISEKFVQMVCRYARSRPADVRDAALGLVAGLICTTKNNEFLLNTSVEYFEKKRQRENEKFRNLEGLRGTEDSATNGAEGNSAFDLQSNASELVSEVQSLFSRSAATSIMSGASAASTHRASWTKITAKDVQLLTSVQALPSRMRAVLRGKKGNAASLGAATEEVVDHVAMLATILRAYCSNTQWNSYYDASKRKQQRQERTEQFKGKAGSSGDASTKRHDEDLDVDITEAADVQRPRVSFFASPFHNLVLPMVLWHMCNDACERALDEIIRVETGETKEEGSAQDSDNDDEQPSAKKRNNNKKTDNGAGTTCAEPLQPEDRIALMRVVTAEQAELLRVLRDKRIFNLTDDMRYNHSHSFTLLQDFFHERLLSKRLNRVTPVMVDRFPEFAALAAPTFESLYDLCPVVVERALGNLLPPLLRLVPAAHAHSLGPLVSSLIEKFAEQDQIDHLLKAIVDSMHDSPSAIPVLLHATEALDAACGASLNVFNLVSLVSSLVTAVPSNISRGRSWESQREVLQLCGTIVASLRCSVTTSSRILKDCNALDKLVVNLWKHLHVDLREQPDATEPPSAFSASLLRVLLAVRELKLAAVDDLGVPDVMLGLHSFFNLEIEHVSALEVAMIEHYLGQLLERQVSLEEGVEGGDDASGSGGTLPPVEELSLFAQLSLQRLTTHVALSELLGKPVITPDEEPPADVHPFVAALPTVLESFFSETCTYLDAAERATGQPTISTDDACDGPLDSALPKCFLEALRRRKTLLVLCAFLKPATTLSIVSHLMRASTSRSDVVVDVAGKYLHKIVKTGKTRCVELGEGAVDKASRKAVRRAWRDLNGVIPVVHRCLVGTGNVQKIRVILHLLWYESSKAPEYWLGNPKEKKTTKKRVVRLLDHSSEEDGSGGEADSTSDDDSAEEAPESSDDYTCLASHSSLRVLCGDAIQLMLKARDGIPKKTIKAAGFQEALPRPDSLLPPTRTLVSFLVDTAEVDGTAELLAAITAANADNEAAIAGILRALADALPDGSSISDEAAYTTQRCSVRRCIGHVLQHVPSILATTVGKQRHNRRKARQASDAYDATLASAAAKKEGEDACSGLRVLLRRLVNDGGCMDLAALCMPHLLPLAPPVVDCSEPTDTSLSVRLDKRTLQEAGMRTSGGAVGKKRGRGGDQPPTSESDSLSDDWDEEGKIDNEVDVHAIEDADDAAADVEIASMSTKVRSEAPVSLPPAMHVPTLQVGKLMAMLTTIAAKAEIGCDWVIDQFDPSATVTTMPLSALLHIAYVTKSPSAVEKCLVYIASIRENWSVVAGQAVVAQFVDGLRAVLRITPCYEATLQLLEVSIMHSGDRVDSDPAQATFFTKAAGLVSSLLATRPPSGIKSAPRRLRAVSSALMHACLAVGAHRSVNNTPWLKLTTAVYALLVNNTKVLHEASPPFIDRTFAFLTESIRVAANALRAGDTFSSSAAEDILELFVAAIRLFSLWAVNYTGAVLRSRWHLIPQLVSSLTILLLQIAERHPAIGSRAVHSFTRLLFLLSRKAVLGEERASWNAASILHGLFTAAGGNVKSYATHQQALDLSVCDLLHQVPSRVQDVVYASLSVPEAKALFKRATSKLTGSKTTTV